MHTTLLDRLNITTSLLLFYGFLTRGYFSEEERQKMSRLIQSNNALYNQLLSNKNLDTPVDLLAGEISRSTKFIDKAKESLKLNQICDDQDIALYISEHHEEFLSTGIRLADLKNICDISLLLENGLTLHDSFSGYDEKDLISYHIDCLDFVYSAAYYYNDGYDYYNGLKKVNLNVDLSRSKFFELKRIHTEEEIMYRNFREAYINILFFMESFINSVGYDAFLKGIAKDEKEENQLKGIQSKKKNGFSNYSNLRQKLENIARIITNNELDTSKGPIRTYLDQEVELRNKYVHSSPSKGRILLSLEDWKSKCDEMIQNRCYEVLSTFWKSCYPKKRFPKILFNEFWGNSFKGHQGKFMK